MAKFEKSKGANGTRPENTWRLQKAARLTGLVMLDVDHMEDDPRKVFAAIPEHWLDDDCDNQILLAHVTPSGCGLRLVCKADPKRGNLADNQQFIAHSLGLKSDACVKNADRLSFAVTAKDIIYIDNQIFTYENEEYDKMYGENYRRGDSRPKQSDLQPTPDPSRAGGEVDCLQGRIQPTDDTQHPSRTGGDGGRLPVINSPSRLEGVAAGRGSREQAAGADALVNTQINAPQPPLILEGELVTSNAQLFRGIKRRDIAAAWLKVKGTPETGERHLTMVSAACDLRYICDNDPVAVCALVKTLPFVQDIIKERGEQEVEKACSDACKYAMKPTLPKAVSQAYKSCKLKKFDEEMEKEDKEKGYGRDDWSMAGYISQWKRLQPFLADENDPYALATYRMADANKIGGVFMAGTMLCTLLTRCWYRHFDGEVHRLNPQTYIIGDPASGKGEGEKMDQIIMAHVIVADRVGREAEAEYKRQQKERSTSSKAQKGEALKRPEFCIRYIPSRTSNAVFFRRAKNAKEEINGEPFPLHLYTFDSELDSNTTAQSGGSWIGKHDIELKAFHNEFTGVDFANADSVNELIQVFYNSVVTGTPISLSKKITLRNVNDGLCSRMAIFRMLSDDYKMIAKGNRNVNADKNCKLKQWAFKFDKLSGNCTSRSWWSTSTPSAKRRPTRQRHRTIRCWTTCVNEQSSMLFGLLFQGLWREQ